MNWTPALIVLLLLATPVSAGQLQIRTEPGAELFWDGVSLGRVAPEGTLRIEDIPPGEYGIEIRKDGFRTFQRRVRVVEGLERIDARLVPRPPVATGGTVESEVGPQPVSLASPQQELPTAELPSLGLATPVAAPPPINRRVMGDPLQQLITALVTMLLLAVVVYLVRRQPSPPESTPREFAPSSAGLAPEPALPLRPGPRPSFLTELKAREALHQEGVEIVPPDRSKVTIEIDPESVQIVED